MRTPIRSSLPTNAPDATAHLASRSRRTKGFTIVEIVLALGIAAFSIMCLLGLISASFQVSMSSSQDTLMASMVRQVSADLHQRPFATLTSAPPTAYYFDDDAHLLTSQQNAIYVCTPVITSDATYSTGSTVNLYQVQLTISSALLPASRRPVMQTVHIAVARHG